MSSFRRQNPLRQCLLAGLSPMFFDDYVLYLAKTHYTNGANNKIMDAMDKKQTLNQIRKIKQ